MAASSIDWSKPGKYPVVLSDALLGKPSKDAITSIRYNHKATQANSTPGNLNLRSTDDSSHFSLDFKDQSDRYEYAGSRTSGDGQYVLIFDKVKQHFVLHRVDSTFDMNLIRAPWTQDAEALRSQYPQLDPQPKGNPPTAQSQPASTTATSSQTQAKKTTKAAKSTAAASAKATAPAKAAPKRQKAESKPKKKQPVKEPTPDPDEDDDSDDGLTIEYPGGPPPDRYNAFSSTPVFQRAISEPSDEDEDDVDMVGFGGVGGKAELEVNQDVDMLQLPSPANGHGGGKSDEELEMDLEAELEAALEASVEESDESEEE